MDGFHALIFSEYSSSKKSKLSRERYKKAQSYLTKMRKLESKYLDLLETVMSSAPNTVSITLVKQQEWPVLMMALDAVEVDSNHHCFAFSQRIKEMYALALFHKRRAATYKNKYYRALRRKGEKDV